MPARHDERILLTGATGFVGSHLLRALAGGSVPMRCLVRDSARLVVPHGADAEVAEADLCNSGSIEEGLTGCTHVYYLVHSMEPGSDEGFAARDRMAAQNYADAARAAGVRRTIYLGGVLPTDEDPTSEHLRSRREVEEILRTAAPETVVLRASMIVGPASASFATLVQLVDRLPVLALPSWRDRRTQPIAIKDVVACLVRARTVPPGTYDVAGPDVLSFREMTEVIAELLGRPYRAVELPARNALVEGAVAAAVTDQDRETVTPLMAGLDHDLVVADNAAPTVFGLEPTPFRAAAEAAIAAMPSI